MHQKNAVCCCDLADACQQEAKTMGRATHFTVLNMRSLNNYVLPIPAVHCLRAYRVCCDSLFLLRLAKTVL